MAVVADRYELQIQEYAWIFHSPSKSATVSSYFRGNPGNNERLGSCVSSQWWTGGSVLNCRAQQTCWPTMQYICPTDILHPIHFRRRWCRRFFCGAYNCSKANIWSGNNIGELEALQSSSCFYGVMGTARSSCLVRVAGTARPAWCSLVNCRWLRVKLMRDACWQAYCSPPGCN